MVQPEDKNMDLKIAYLAPELGTLTSTFVYREIAAHRAAGLSVTPFSTHRPTETVRSAEAAPLIQETAYLYNIPKQRLLSAAIGAALRRPVRFLSTVTTALRDACCAKVPAPPDRAKMLWHFIVGCALAGRLYKSGITHIHAHFGHVPAAIAMYAAQVAGISFSFTVHANDIFERPTALREKASRSAFVACISEYHRQYLIERGCPVAKVRIVHCGLNLDDYPCHPHERVHPPRLFSVGRFVEKKGFHILIEALAILKQEKIPFRMTIVGNGPLFDSIRQSAGRAELTEYVHFLGSRPQEEVRTLLNNADLFVLPCVVARSGDRDGIPVALMEAMAIGVPVISTPVAGIPELIQQEHNGLLVKPGDAADLAQAIKTLLKNPRYARQLSENARRTIEKEFDIRHNAAMLREAIADTLEFTKISTDTRGNDHL